MHLGGRESCDVHTSACVEKVTNLGVHQLHFAQSPLCLCHPDHLSDVSALTCSLQAAGVPHAGIDETSMPHYLRAETPTVSPLVKSACLPAKI